MSPISRSPLVSAPASPNPSYGSGVASQPPPLPEKKTVNRTVSAPDANGKSFLHPRLSFTGSEINVCRPGDAGSRASLPSSPVDPRSIFSSNESLERCHAPLGRPSRSRTLDEPPKVHGRLGVHSRSSLTCVSSPQLSSPFPGAEAGVAANLGSTLQLQTLLSNIDNREGVYSKLGGLYAESLRRLALKCEEHFNRVRRKPLRFEESSWSLFRLTSNRPSCLAGDAVYYSAACASDPSHSYAVKVHLHFTECLSLKSNGGGGSGASGGSSRGGGRGFSPSDLCLRRRRSLVCCILISQAGGLFAFQVPVVKDTHTHTPVQNFWFFWGGYYLDGWCNVLVLVKL